MVVLMSLVGLITSLNQQFQVPMKAAYLIQTGKMANFWATLLNFAFFVAYLVMGGTGARYIQKHGYKKTLSTGLGVLLIGFSLYMVSAWVFETFDISRFQLVIDQARVEGDAFEYTGKTVLPTAYWVFLVAAFASGSALTFIQAAINPYLVACEVPGTSGVQRQNIAGTGNSLMTTLVPLFVAYVIFQQKEGVDVEISSLYLPMTVLLIFVAILLVTLRFLELPEIESVSAGDEELPRHIWSFRHVRWGFIALFCLVGMEVCLGANIVLYATEDLSFTYGVAAQMAFLYWCGMLAGRLLGSFLSNVSARTQLAVGASGAALLLLVALLIHNPWLFCGMGFFHSVMWSAIFALSVDGLGPYTAKGSGLVIMGCFGGAVLPVLQGALAGYLGSWTWTWLIVLVCEAVILYYALVTSKISNQDKQAL